MLSLYHHTVPGARDEALASSARAGRRGVGQRAATCSHSNTLVARGAAAQRRCSARHRGERETRTAAGVHKGAAVCGAPVLQPHAFSRHFFSVFLAFFVTFSHLLSSLSPTFSRRFFFSLFLVAFSPFPPSLFSLFPVIFLPLSHHFLTFSRRFFSLLPVIFLTFSHHFSHFPPSFSSLFLVGEDQHLAPLLDALAPRRLVPGVCVCVCVCVCV